MNNLKNIDRIRIGIFSIFSPSRFICRERESDTLGFIRFRSAALGNAEPAGKTTITATLGGQLFVLFSSMRFT